jgi:hypothetical protein
MGPLGALVFASYSYRSWLKYEIVVSIPFGLLLLFKPDFMYTNLVKLHEKNLNILILLISFGNFDLSL